jgi:aminopeptidase YwaD
VLPAGSQYLTAFSYYDLPEEIEKTARDIISRFSGITEGVQWPQGDHIIFIQNGCPAIAVSSQWFTENVESQGITHTPQDNIEIVDCHKLVEIARALNLILTHLTT